MPAELKVPHSVFLKLYKWKVWCTFVSSAMMAAVTGFAGMDWDKLQTHTIVLIVFGIIGGVSIAMKALIDDTAAKLAKGELPFGDVSVELSPTPGTIQKVHTTQDKTITTPPASQ